MKIINRILHILTMFLASIGICTFLLVCFILIYPKFFGNFSQKEKDTTLQNDIAVTLSDDVEADPENMLALNYQEDDLPKEQYDKIVDSDIEKANQNRNTEEVKVHDLQNISETSSDKDSWIQATEDATVSNETQNSADTQTVIDNIGNTDEQIVIGSEENQNEEITYTPEIASQNDVAEPSRKTNSTSGNNNFNTYDNAAQQQTDDLYVLNTSSMKIHYKTCNSVKKIAPQNYSTTSISIDELIAQGYFTCGICFK